VGDDDRDVVDQRHRLGRLQVLHPELIALRIFLAATLLLGACADDAPEEDPPVNCAKETADEFTVGLEKTGIVLDVKLMSALPAPPIGGNNDWIIQITTVAGAAPVTDATIDVTPFMNRPQQHGTPVKVIVTPMPGAGEYKLSPVNLWMPGVWETTIDMSSPAGSDSVVYKFCIPS
jgi:YtkA-like